MADDPTAFNPETTRPSFKNQVLSFIWKNFLIFAIVISLIFAIITGVLLKFVRKDGIFTKREVMYIKFLGTLFIRGLNLVTAPLVIANMISSLTKLNLSHAKILGIRTFIYFLISNLLASAWGSILVVTIVPGRGLKNVEMTNHTFAGEHITLVDSLMDLIRSLCPSNYLEAAFRSHITVVVPPMKEVVDENGTVVHNPDGSVKQQKDFDVPTFKWDIKYLPVSQTNYISLTIFSLVFGLAALRVTKSRHMVIEIFDGISQVVYFSVIFIQWASPVGVYCLLCAKVIEERHWTTIFVQVGWYSFTVVIGILTYGFIFMQLIYILFVRKNPFTFTFNMIEAIITAFATSSSWLTLPVTLRCVTEKNGIPPIVARFVVPLGASFNMNGTSLYETVAPIFIAQVLKRELTVPQLTVTWIIATLASIAAAGIPQSGIVTMLMVLSLLNLEPDTLVYIIPVDWLLDRFNTSLNVFGDAVGAAVIYTFSKPSLEKLQLMESQHEDILM